MLDYCICFHDPFNLVLISIRSENHQSTSWFGNMLFAWSTLFTTSSVTSFLNLLCKIGMFTCLTDGHDQRHLNKDIQISLYWSMDITGQSWLFRVKTKTSLHWFYRKSCNCHLLINGDGSILLDPGCRVYHLQPLHFDSPVTPVYKHPWPNRSSGALPFAPLEHDN